jgi:hypothetical protein
VENSGARESISDPSSVEVGISGDEEVPQATKGDVCVIWVGKVK